ncbi:hypothetical protein GALMADRAFT_733870 [Galerina marginata CBS 339.88]|uniref:DUF6533 domain-containing protein n=1 Tax=Galerina marginata (strain CBS 339.88) TaxID=685588 RepID=A0A067SYL3_GALM3|nr:hypothetical protein GALMADRAFT_733870 [Galerina marginata CBS 339.88]
MPAYGINLDALTINIYIWFASYTIVLYDYICTFRTEVAYAWPCPWSPGLVLFYLNRYLPFVDIIIFMRTTLFPFASPSACLWTLPLMTWVAVFGLFVSETIILLRTYAMWGGRTSIHWIFLVVVLGIFSTMLALLAWKTALDYKESVSLVGEVPPDQFSCQVSAFSFANQSTLCLLIFYLLAFVGEAIIVTLTAIKAKQHVPKVSTLWISELYKTGIIYCCCMLTLSLINSIMIFFGPVAYKPIFIIPERALHSVFCNRVVFLVLKNRMPRRGEDIETNRRSTYRGSTTDVFTSFFSDTNVDAQEVSSGTIP